MECHLVGCEGCLDEAEFMQMIVAGLRAMPVVRPPADFVEKTLTRWGNLGCHCGATPSQQPDVLAPPESFPEATVEAVVRLVQRGPRQMAAPALPRAPALPASACPAEGKAPAPAPPARRPSWLSRSYNAVTIALMAVLFVTGLFAGQWFPGGRIEDAAFAGMLQSTPLEQISSRALPVTMDVAGAGPLQPEKECLGRSGDWNATCLKMSSPRPLRVCEVHLAVPAGLRVELQESRYEPLQIAAITASREDDGHWQGHLRWYASEPGRYSTFLEVRSDGVYRRAPITFVAVR